MVDNEYLYPHVTIITSPLHSDSHNPSPSSHISTMSLSTPPFPHISLTYPISPLFGCFLFRFPLFLIQTLCHLSLQPSSNQFLSVHKTTVIQSSSSPLLNKPIMTSSPSSTHFSPFSHPFSPFHRHTPSALHFIPSHHPHPPPPQLPPSSSLSLPSLTVIHSTSSYLYFPGPFTSATFLSCHLCTCFISSVATILKLEHCSHIKISAAAARVIVQFDFFCFFLLATVAFINY